VIIAGQENIGATPKTVMRVALGRTDMKGAFSTLPPAIRHPFEQNPGTLVSLVMDAVNGLVGTAGGPAKRVRNDTPVIRKKLFTDAQFRGDPHHNTDSPFKQVTCEKWLVNIAKVAGQDLLTADNYPVRSGLLGDDSTDLKAKELLGSFGALNRRMDPGNKPIFEIRSGKQILATLITPYAIDYFKYVQFLHDPTLTESTRLANLSPNDRATLAGPESGGRSHLLREMLDGAR
jgi:hypothetical protein